MWTSYQNKNLNTQTGDIIIPHNKFHKWEIPEGVTTARNGYALTTILNNHSVTLDFSEPLLFY